MSKRVLEDFTESKYFDDEDDGVFKKIKLNMP